jgi:hypothetical protein
VCGVEFGLDVGVGEEERVAAAVVRAADFRKVRRDRDILGSFADRVS